MISRRLTEAHGSRSIAAMADAPRATTARRLAQTARDARLAHALRDNLRRRKEQARDRETRAADVAEDAAPNDERTA
jgi:hypothetical protein